MRDLVETVIGQVLQKDKQGLQARGDHKTDQASNFKSEFFKRLDDSKPILTPPTPVVKDKALWDVSVKFEAIFFQQMMQAMRKTVPESGFMPHGFAEGVEESMFDQAISDSGSRSGSLGIAMNIYRQLEHTQGHEKADSGEVRKQAIQEMRQASDMEDMSMYTKLRGDVDGSH